MEGLPSGSSEELHLLALITFFLLGQENLHGVEMKLAHSPLNEIPLFEASRLVTAAKHKASAQKGVLLRLPVCHCHKYHKHKSFP